MSMDKVRTSKMYHAIRTEALDRCEWKGDKLAVQFIEACRYDGDIEADETNFVKGTLTSEKDLQHWLDGNSMLPKRSPAQAAKVTGGIKLLVCDRAQYAPLDLSLSRRAFESMERSFNLAAMTMSTFESDIGTYSRFLVYSDNDPPELERIHTILKAPQKREILNWGLSLSYDVASNVTNGFLYGTQLDSPWARESYSHHEHAAGSSSLGWFLHRIKGAIEAWDHPMLLPCLFLSEHLACTNEFCTKGNLLMECVRIEHQLGVTKVGQSAYLIKQKQAGERWQPSAMHDNKFPTTVKRTDYEAPAKLSREDTENLTVRINTQSTRVAFTARSPEWNLACAHFVLETLVEVRPSLQKSHARSHRDLKQLVEHNIVLAEAAAHNVAVIKERMALQLNVLYSVIAQLDNQTSAELAASASRDSTSMKILAFISALFLPGSFVSGMFSMGLFRWDQGSNGSVLSSKFWIYWAVALPLTVITVVGWASWWYFELNRFEKKMQSLRGARDAKKSETQGP